MAQSGKVPDGVTVRAKKSNYPVRVWKVTSNSHMPSTRRVIFQKHRGWNAPIRLELHGEREALASMFAEIAAALWGLDGEEPEDDGGPLTILLPRKP